MFLHPNIELLELKVRLRVDPVRTVLDQYPPRGVEGDTEVGPVDLLCDNDLALGCGTRCREDRRTGSDDVVFRCGTEIEQVRRPREFVKRERRGEQRDQLDGCLK